MTKDDLKKERNHREILDSLNKELHSAEEVQFILSQYSRHLSIVSGYCTKGTLQKFHKGINNACHSIKNIQNILNEQSSLTELVNKIDDYFIELESVVKNGDRSVIFDVAKNWNDFTDFLHNNWECFKPTKVSEIEILDLSDFTKSIRSQIKRQEKIIEDQGSPKIHNFFQQPKNDNTPENIKPKLSL